MKTTEYINQLVETDRDAWIAEYRAVQAVLRALEYIYGETVTQSPKATVDAFTGAVGVDMAKAIIASLVNRSAWDGRISRKASEWAKTVAGAYDEKACERLGLYSNRIHMAHLDQIALELMTR